MSTVDYQEMGRNIVTSVTKPLATSSLSNMNAKSVHAYLLRSRHALRNNGCHWHVISSKFCHWVYCERGKQQKSSTSDFMVCMEMPAWMPAVSEGGWNILRTETRTSPISRAVVDWELLQLSEKAKVNELIKQDRRVSEKLQCSLEWDTMRSRRRWRFWDIEEFHPVRFPVCLRVQRNTKRPRTALPSILQSGFGPPQTITCSDPWKITWELTTTRLTKQPRKPCEAGCKELERTSTAETFLRFCNAG
jgi:hypothetical protein